MKILVTGGAGFIGSHLTDALIEAGHEVVVVDNFSTGCRENLNGQAKFYEADVRDVATMAHIFAVERFDIVFHEAAQTMVGYSMEHPVADADLNIMGLLNILENCRNYGVKRVVYSSSAAVYGENQNVPIKEEAPVIPLSFYGLTKITAEQYLKLYHDTFGLDYVVLR